MSLFPSRVSSLRFALALLVVLSGTLPLTAQSRFATTVVNFSPGPNANPSFSDPTLFLGGPQGGGFSNGSLDIVSLGIGGSLTVGFDVTIVDGPGADLTVSENSFVFSGGVFAEVTFVEVSTDGVQFARFPTRYAGPQGPLPAFGTSPMGTFGGLCGGLPGLANITTNTVDPFDPVESGGESFDLADLANDPLVTGGQVNLNAIHFVRVVDVEEGAHMDSFGNLIWDHGGPTSSADVDAVTVLNHDGNATGMQPVIDFRIDGQGFLHMEISDPDGFSDLDLSTLQVSMDLQPVPFKLLRRLMRVVGAGPNGIKLRSRNPIVGSGIQRVFGASIQDRAGEFAGDQAILPG
jgi:hypothetical protein